MSPQNDGGRWNATAYDDDQSFVAEYGEDVLGLLEPQDGERILDLGCGTGRPTARIAERGASVVGLDSSPTMIAAARRSHPAVPFVRADVRDLPVGGPFDAAFSNAALHWIPDGDQDAVLAEVRDALAPGGRFVAELGGHGNVRSIVEAVETELEARGDEATTPWYFPTVGEYAPRLEAAGFEVRYARLFDRPTELEGREGLRSWLEQFGDDWFAPLSPDERDAVIEAVEDRLREDRFRDGSWTADYRRLRFVAVRE